MSRQSYVAGFMFCTDADAVLLVQKLRPQWQAGLWNGVGGKAELGETPPAAMRREFLEEVGRDVENWERFCTEFGRDYVVHFFRCRILTVDWDVPDKNDAGEKLAWHSLTTAPPVIGNLSWLIPLALDPRGFTDPIIVSAASDISGRPTW